MELTAQVGIVARQNSMVLKKQKQNWIQCFSKSSCYKTMTLEIYTSHATHQEYLTMIVNNRGLKATESFRDIP